MASSDGRIAGDRKRPPYPGSFALGENSRTIIPRSFRPRTLNSLPRLPYFPIVASRPPRSRNASTCLAFESGDADASPRNVDAETRRREGRSGRRRRRVNDRSEKKRDPRARGRSERTSPRPESRRKERGVYIRYLIGDLRPTLNETNAFTCLLRLPSRIHSPFHFKCSAALFWVAALSPRPPRCTHHSCLCPPPPLLLPRPSTSARHRTPHRP